MPRLRNAVSPMLLVECLIGNEFVSSRLRHRADRGGVLRGPSFRLTLRSSRRCSPSAVEANRAGYLHITAICDRQRNEMVPMRFVGS